jgi:hypothetical protein
MTSTVSVLWFAHQALKTSWSSPDVRGEKFPDVIIEEHEPQGFEVLDVGCTVESSNDPTTTL